ncbi:MAG: PHP domain-containing protein [Zestosphaera sp.]
MGLHADFHIHSYVSDGEPSPTSIVRYSLRKGLNVISVTDHNSFLGSILASRTAKDLRKVVVVCGAEIRTYWGDVLILCREPIKIVRDPIELRDEAQRNSCLLIPAHPFDVLRLGIGLRIKYDFLWDGFELFNSSSDPMSNLMSFLYLKNMGRPLLSNSDAHTLEGVGVSKNIIETNDPNPEEVLEAIRRGLIKPMPSYSIPAWIFKLRWSFRTKPFQRLLKERHELLKRLRELHPHLLT